MSMGIRQLLVGLLNTPRRGGVGGCIPACVVCVVSRLSSNCFGLGGEGVTLKAHRMGL